MNLSSLYNKISESNIVVESSAEPPPIINSDVSQYTNVLSKKSYLNDKKVLLKENTPPQQVQPAAQSTAQQPLQATSKPPDFPALMQSVQKKYNSATVQEKALIVKILSSLS